MSPTISEKSEDAMGIPSKAVSHDLPEIDSPTVWEFGVHDHYADRRGRHFDLRLGDPSTGHAHSWAMHADWPKPGESTWAIQQPTHTIKYMDFQGTIGDGYGKGDVILRDRDKVEVASARPGHIAFSRYTSKGPQEYSLHRLTGKHWILHNRTLTSGKHPDLPDSKPTYRQLPIDKLPYDDPNYILSAKIDDAHNLFYLPKAGDNVRVLSYRRSKRSGDLIEHTQKVPSLHGIQVPPGLGGTILRGGLYALDPKTGKATPAEQLAGMLNSDVWKSREKQKVHGELLPVLYDVVRFKGRNVEKAPYSEKLKILREVEKSIPAFHLPRMATSPEAKKKLVADVRSGEIPETEEGVVAWNLNHGTAPIKGKFKDEHDVYIRDFFPGEGKYKDKAVGGFLFSHEPSGPIVGKVGTGLSDALRKDMFEHPENYRGLVARVAAQQKYQSGALRAPAFEGWHLDKNDPEQVAKIKTASGRLSLSFIW